jgi:hypothetical protein
VDPVEQRRITKAFLPAARRIANKVDPLDLVTMGASKDEYDALVAESAKWLAQGAADVEVRLAQFIRRHYQVAPNPAKVRKLTAELAAAWRAAR